MADQELLSRAQAWERVTDILASLDNAEWEHLQRKRAIRRHPASGIARRSTRVKTRWHGDRLRLVAIDEAPAETPPSPISETPLHVETPPSPLETPPSPLETPPSPLETPPSPLETPPSPYSEDFLDQI